ncbi:MAG TPA: protein kinase [Mycobacteriales bacterium]|nr:protein kinase [Mycobacteriales bacterium]
MDEPFSVPGYRLLGLLGFGGTGEVWRGVHEASGQPVALKRLWDPAGPALVDRLRAEADALADAVGHHAVAVHDVVLLAGSEVVVVTDYAAGGSLAGLLASRPALRPPEAVTLLGPLARGLAAAHARGLRHGDLTPSNVLFTANGRPVLSDFGLALATGERRADDPAFRDPAPAAGGDPTLASDVYALGAIGYAALTGTAPRLPDAAGTTPAVTELAPDVPAGLASVIEAAIDPDPARRPEAAAFAAAVLRSSGADPIRFADQRSTPPPGGEATVTEGPHVYRRHALTVVIVASVGLAALTGAGWVRLGQRPAVADAPASAPATPVPPTGLAVPSSTAPTAPDAAASITSGDVAAGTGAADHGEDYRAVLAHLLALRDRAFDTGRLSVLRQIYPKGSEGWRVDAAALGVLRSQHLHTRGFTEHLDTITMEDESSVSVELAVTTTVAPYVVVNAAGRVVARRAGRQQSFEVTLRHAGDGWRVQGLGPVAR